MHARDVQYLLKVGMPFFVKVIGAMASQFLASWRCEPRCRTSLVSKQHIETREVIVQLMARASHWERRRKLSWKRWR